MQLNVTNVNCTLKIQSKWKITKSCATRAAVIHRVNFHTSSQHLYSCKNYENLEKFVFFLAWTWIIFMAKIFEYRIYVHKWWGSPLCHYFDIQVRDWAYMQKCINRYFYSKYEYAPITINYMCTKYKHDIYSIKWCNVKDIPKR